MNKNFILIFVIDQYDLHYPAENGHFYFVHKHGTTEECREHCSSEGGKLLDVRDEIQHKAMREVIIEFWNRTPLNQRKTVFYTTFFY